jgi:hypothetical protein
MKKILLLLSLLTICLTQAQTDIFNLSGGGALPAGWVGVNNVTTNLIDRSTYYLLDAGNPGDIITTASYDLSAYASANFDVKVATFGGSTNNPAFIEFSLDGGATFNSLGSTNTPTSTTYIDGGTQNITAVSNQVVLRISNAGTSGKGVRLKDIILRGIGAVGANQPPTITNIQRTPATDPVGLNTPVGVTATITDAESDAIATATLDWSFTDNTLVVSTGSVTMTQTGTTSTWSATIPGQALSGTMSFTSTATDGNTTQASTTTPAETYSILPPQPEGLQLAVVNTLYTIDFDTTVANVNNGSFAGLGLAPVPSAGQLDADAFIVNGMSEGDTNFGDTKISGDYAGPITAPGIVTSGGMYAFEIVTGNVALGFQATGNDFNPGQFIMRFTNTTGAVLTSLKLGFDLYVYNDQDRATAFKFAHGATQAGLIDIPFLDINTIEAAATSPLWQRNAVKTELTGLSIANGATYLLAFNFADFSGSGSRDEVAIDNINIIANPTTADFSIGGVVETLLLNGDLTLTAALSVAGAVNLENATLTTNDNLTLTSEAGKTAVIAPVVNSTIVGHVTVEQFYPAKRAFRLVTPSVAMSATIFQQWQQAGLNASDSGFLPGTGTHITGGTSLNGFDQTATNNPSAFLYNNATQAWQSLNNTNQALTAGSPLRLFIRGDRTVNITGNTPAATATKLVSSGTVRIGDVNVTGLATAAGGYSLIGNPYQAQVDLAAALQDPTTVDVGKNFFYIWDPTLGARGAYSTFDIIAVANNIAGSQVNRFLQPGQAVFLDTADTDSDGTITPSLTVKETHKAGSSVTTGTYFNSHPVAGLRLNLFATSELASGIARDGVMLHFETTGNNGIDHKDAKKFTNLDENLAVVVGTAKLAVASHAVPIDGERIPLYLSGLGSMDYTFAVSLDNNVGCTVSLEDTHTGQSHPISAAGATITFTPAASNATRFYLKFMDNTLSSDDTAFAKAITLYPNPNDGQTMHLQGFKKSDEVQVYLRNMAGQLLFSEKSMPLNGVLNIYGLPILSKGLYIVEIIQGTQKTLLKNSIN